MAKYYWLDKSPVHHRDCDCKTLWPYFMTTKGHSVLHQGNLRQARGKVVFSSSGPEGDLVNIYERRPCRNCGKGK